MLEGGANNVDYEVFQEAITIGHAESVRIINSIQSLATDVKTFKSQSQPPASQDNFRELRDTVYR
jgi:polyribonucleotide nucleotidyltransferase